MTYNFFYGNLMTKTSFGSKFLCSLHSSPWFCQSWISWECWYWALRFAPWLLQWSPLFLSGNWASIIRGSPHQEYIMSTSLLLYKNRNTIGSLISSCSLQHSQDTEWFPQSNLAKQGDFEPNCSWRLLSTLMVERPWTWHSLRKTRQKGEFFKKNASINCR